MSKWPDPIHAAFLALLRAERSHPVAVHYQRSRMELRARARVSVAAFRKKQRAA